jgi:hypothetical protein
MALMDTVQQHLGQSEISQISQQLGVSPDAAQAAIAAAVPMIVGGMASHASQPQGASSIQQAITAHDGVTDNVGAVLQSGPPADVGGSGGLLGRILGNHHDAVQQSVQQASGLDGEKAKKLLMMLSPIVLGVLARRQFGGQPAQQADPGQLGNVLQQEAQTAAQHSPHVGGLLGKILGAVQTPRT